jgi:hypothetical protein
MQIIFRPVRRDDKGFALIITMIFLGVSLLIFGSMMFWISSNAKVTMRNNQYNMSSGAAEAAVETALSQMDRDFLGQSLSNASAYTTLTAPMTNWPAQYVFSGTNGATNQISVYLGPPATNMVPLNSQFAGLYGLAQDAMIVATATPTIQSGVTPVSVPATVREILQFASIPLFQFAIFYNIDLEICPGQPMLITGPVFSNAGMWAGSGQTTFSNTVTAVGSAVDTTANDPYTINYHPQGGNPTFLMAGQPTVRNDPLVMPIGTNNDTAAVRSIVEIPPPANANGTAAAYTTNGMLYLMNAADLIISNSPSGTNNSAPVGTNLFVFFQDPSVAPYLTPINPDFYKLKNTSGGSSTNYVSTNPAAGLYSSTNVQYAGYTFLTNALFYDWREGLNSGNAKAVQAVQINIGKFNTWVTNTATNGGSFISANYNSKNSTDKGHWIDSMYVYNAVSNTTTTLPAVRVVNGAQLSSSYGFTIVTPFPMYVFGNFNSQTPAGSSLGVNSTGLNTWPAALMADSVTILSTGWSDATNSLDPNTAQDTTVNAALLEGIEPSNPAINGVSYSGHDSSGKSYSGSYAGYSGGVENFMRLLEDWGSQTLTYNGSIVVMYPSKYATNYWAGDYYGVPTRHWAFDTNFKNQSGLPPLTPQFKTVVRGQWLAQ